jgi:hypothetical protein
MTKKDELTSDLLEFVTIHNLPFSIVESPLLGRLVSKSYGIKW